MLVIIIAFFSPLMVARRYFDRCDNTGWTDSRAFFWSSTPSIRSRTTPATGRPTECTGTNKGRWQPSAGVSHRYAWQRTRPKTQLFPAVVVGYPWTWLMTFLHFPGTCDIVKSEGLILYFNHNIFTYKTIKCIRIFNNYFIYLFNFVCLGTT